MIVDPRVAKRKFDRDIAPLVEDPAAFAALGIRLIEGTFPTLRVSLAWPKRQLEIPLELAAPDWDFRPPSATWVKEDGSSWDGPVPSGNGLQLGAGFEYKLNLGIATFLALSDAVAAFGDGTVYPALDAPATAERVLAAINRVTNV